MKEFTLTTSDGLPLSCALFESVESPDQGSPASGIVQIVHGAKECKEKYYDFASFLAGSGYHVILSDLRGHGASVNNEYTYGHMGSWQLLVSDLVMISRYAQNHFAEAGNALPLTLFGHSFGSVLARCYLQQNDQLIDKLILTGTVRCQDSARLVVPVCKAAVRVQGDRKPAGFPLKYGEPAPLDQKYPVMKYSNGSVLTIWASNIAMQRRGWTAKNPSLRILSLTSSDDPVTGGEKGLERTEKCMRAQGYKDFRRIVYSDSAHQPLFSGARKQAQEDILAFLRG